MLMDSYSMALYNKATNLFCIILIKNNEVVIKILNVKLNELIKVLYDLIEKVEKYNERVKNEYSFFSK